MKFLSVDFQRDFSREGGQCYRSRSCTRFIVKSLIPHLIRSSTRTAEIISDYRLPRPGDDYQCCVPGTDGYISDVPDEVKEAPVWVKCMNSPLWTRDNAGDPNNDPGLPRQAPTELSDWFLKMLGNPGEHEIVLFGLTLDCCVLCTAQELTFRGYQTRYLVEGVDSYSGDLEEKKSLLNGIALNWGKPIQWEVVIAQANSYP